MKLARLGDSHFGRACRVLATAFALFCSVVSPANAGTLQPSSVHGCDYLFSGLIERGDLALFEPLGGTYSGETVCFDSPGGSLLEGQKIFHYIWNRQIGTRVQSGQNCMSACGIAFLGGSLQQGTSNIQIMDRSISPGANLGFHAPSLNLQGSTYSSEQVNQAFELALRAAEGLFGIKSTNLNGVYAMNDFLYQQILRTNPDDMYMIDTIGRANMAGIPLKGLKYPNAMSKDMMENICDTAFLKTQQGLLPDFPTLEQYYAKIRQGVYGGPRVSLTRTGDRYLGIVRDYPTEQNSYGTEVACLMSFWDDTMSRAKDHPRDAFSVSFPRIQTVDDVTELQGINWAEGDYYSSADHLTAPAWFLFDPDTKITTIAGQGATAQPNVGLNTPPRIGQCFVFSSTAVLDSEPCQSSAAYLNDDKNHIVESFIWPSGSKTIVETLLSERRTLINGAQTNQIEVSSDDTRSRIHRHFKTRQDNAGAASFEARCWMNPSTNKNFCFQELG